MAVEADPGCRAASLLIGRLVVRFLAWDLTDKTRDQLSDLPALPPPESQTLKYICWAAIKIVKIIVKESKSALQT